MESSFSQKMKAEYTTDALREYAKDVKSALAIPPEKMPDAPLSIKRGKTHAEIGCQVGSVYAVKTEWGKALFIGHQQGNSRFYTEDDDIVPQLYIPEFNPTIETKCFPFFCSTKGIQIIQKYSLEKIIEHLENSYIIGNNDGFRPRDWDLSLLGEGAEARVYATRHSPRIAMKSFKEGNYCDSLYIGGGRVKKTPKISRIMNWTYFGFFTALNCFMVSPYLIKKVIEPIPKKYCSFTENEDFFAVKEVLASAVGPRLVYSDLVHEYHLNPKWSWWSENSHPILSRKFKEKTKLSKKLFREINDEIKIIGDILHMMDPLSHIEFFPQNLLVKSYQNGILQLIPIDYGKKYFYLPANPKNVSGSRGEEVIRNFFVENEQYKKEIYDKLIRDPFYEAYMRTHFIKEQAPDMFRDFGLAEVVKPVFV